MNFLASLKGFCYVYNKEEVQMSLFVVESSAWDWNTEKSACPDFQVVWIAGRPKRIDATPGKREVAKLSGLVNAFNNKVLEPVISAARTAGVADKMNLEKMKPVHIQETSWFSRQLAIEATPEHAAAFAENSGLKVTPDDGRRYPPMGP
jgi:hypothetical protein